MEPLQLLGLVGLAGVSEMPQGEKEGTHILQGVCPISTSGYRTSDNTCVAAEAFPRDAERAR